MTERFRSGLGIALILVGVLGLEVLGLRSGTLGVVLIGLLIGIAAVILAVRLDLKWAGVGAACAAAFTLTWNGWFVGPLRPGDVLVLVALICFVLADPNHSLKWPPWWIKQLGWVILLVATIHVFMPADSQYLSHRIVITATGKPTVSTKGSLVAANLGVAFKFIVAVVFIAVVFTAAARVERRAVKWLTVSFVMGSAVSAAVAFSDYLGTHFSRILVHGAGCSSTIGASCASRGGGRQLGFSNHPNFLSAGIVIAVPLCIWLMAKRDKNRRDFWLGAAMLPFLFLGVFASGSRGGAVCVVLALSLSIVIFPRTRQFLLGWVVFGAVLVGFVIVLFPHVGHKILQVTRLAGGSATAGSNSVRKIVGAQGVADWHHAPIQGVGLQVSFEASQVYLQELAAGGLLLFTAMTVYMLGGMISSYVLMREDDLAAAILACLISTLALNIFEADLTDRFYYVPSAILVALLYVRSLDAAPPDGDEASPHTVDPVPAGARKQRT
jgi:hypothetical protein